MSLHHLSLAAAALAAALSLALPAHASAPKKTLTAFASEQELSDLFKRWGEAHRIRMEAERKRRDEARAQGSLAQSSPAPAAMAAKSMAAEASAASADSITNVQHAGVDEGGIVKLHGEHLVILRRGRLFTVKVGDRQLAPVSVADAFGPGVDPRGAWYDEMLISGSSIVVIGYSYQRGGTEIGLFDIAADGQLGYKSTHHLRSNDYYSSRNYASRLIGSKLVFYTPLRLNPFHADPTTAFPAVRRWRPGATPAEFRRIAPATRIYRAAEDLDPYRGLALHTVTTCDLAKPELDCESTAVMGPQGRVFHVSPGSVFVWTASSAVFRIPLDGSAPSALKATGTPIDQFSFLEGADGHLNVLLRADGRRGEGMWGSEAAPGDLALFRAPLASFSDGSDAAPRSSYRRLPRVQGHALQNRFVGQYLLYGAGAGWRRAAQATNAQVFAVKYASEDFAYEIPLPHGVDRIEALGPNAVVVGSDGRDLSFTSLRLARYPVAVDRYVRKDAAQGETRSHGFFFKALDGQEGLVGLPIIGGRQGAGRQLRHESAALLYLKSEALSFSELGTLESRPSGTADGCRASCVDWYGNSRPLFLGKRIFALMGYEIVEGRLQGGRMAELNRVNFAPATMQISR